MLIFNEGKRHMSDDSIQPSTRHRLRQRAQQAGISMDAMLNQLLDEGTRLLVQNIVDLVTVHTPQGYYRYVTPSVTQILGYTPDDLVGRRGAEFVHPDDMPVFRQGYKDLMINGVSRLEYRARHRDGRYIWFETMNHAVKHPETGEVIEIIAVSHDITQQRQTAQALSQSEEYYRMLFQEAPIAIWKQDFSAMRAYLQALIEREGITDIETYLCQHPETVSNCLKLVKILDANPTTLRLYHAPSIEEIQTRFHQIVDVGNSQPASLAAIANGETRFSGEFINRISHGKEIYLLLKWLVLPGHEQTFTEVLVVTVDITEQKRYQASLIENERLTSQFRHERDHNYIIQQSISALAHDLRTPLAVINTSKDLLLRHFDKLTEEKRREKLESIGRQLEFALELIDDTVKRARGVISERPFNPSAVNLDKLCKVSIQEMRDGGNGRLSFVNQAHVQVAWVDDILISRILLNLVGNALKYSPPNAPVRLELDKDESHLILRVVDKGIGIAPEHLPHIFEPFYRVDENSPIQGTGLGLSIVKDCVSRHGGTVEVSSTLGIGTTFTVRLPYHDVLVGVG